MWKTFSFTIDTVNENVARLKHAQGWM